MYIKIENVYNKISCIKIINFYHFVLKVFPQNKMHK